MKSSYVKVHTAVNGEFTVDYCSGNNKIISSTEGFKTPASVAINIYAMSTLFSSTDGKKVLPFLKLEVGEKEDLLRTVIIRKFQSKEEV